MTSRWQRTDAPRGDDYDARWATMAVRGENPHGEADFVMRFAPASVLDAGCGTGRVGTELSRRGVDVVGIDLDEGMLATARQKSPELSWVHADLAAMELRDGSGVLRRFDLVVLAGNVMIFLEPGTEVLVVDRLAGHLLPGGRIVAGFQLQPGRFSLVDHDAAMEAAGLQLEARYATWAGDPFVAPGTYAVSVHRAVAG